MAIAWVLIVAVAATWLLRHVWRRPSRWRTVFIRFVIASQSLCWSLLAVEVVFRNYAASEGTDLGTYAGALWQERYWYPTNWQGRRDINHWPERVVGKKICYVVGDSFASGWGVRFEETQPRQLQARLGDSWEVILVAQPGWDTALEEFSLRQEPFLPDVIILNWYVNDYFPAHVSVAGRPHGVPDLSVPWWINRSAAANFAYWRLYRPGIIKKLTSDYSTIGDFDERAWKIHKSELACFCDYANFMRSRLIVVLWPDLSAPQGTRDVLEHVRDFFVGQGADVINLDPLLAKRPSRDKVCNSLDSHPNAELQREAVDLIWDRWHGQS